MIEWWAQLIIIADIIFLLMIFFNERNSPARILLWAAVLIFLPIVGFVVYIVIGQTFYGEAKFRKKSIRDDAIDGILTQGMEQAKAESNPDYSRTAQAILRTGGLGFSDNNDVKFYDLGEEKFADLYADLRNAKKYIHLEYYIIRNDELGNELFSILTQKVREGVEVKLLTDDFGVLTGPHKSIKAFKEAGGEFAVFHKVLWLIFSPKKNNRNHRKLAVIDGKIGYCGGFNIGDEYLGKGPLGFWRDTAVRVVGYGVIPIHMRFEMDWEYASKSTLDITQYYAGANLDQSGDAKMIAVSGGPDVAAFNPIRMQYLTMINNAKKSVYLHSPYFIPDNSLKDALSLAAARGVDVRVIIPDKPDHLFVFWNNISSAYDVMGNGVRVFMYNRGFVHSKTMVVDEEICSVGSANFDDRSLVLNFETNMLIMSKSLGKQMADAFREDLEYCTEYKMEQFEKLTFIQSIRLAISRLFVNLT